MSRLYIVRHGNTFAPGETPRRIGRRTDLALVESGIAQAEALGRHFAAEGIRFARAYGSPLSRTRRTAAIILAHQPDAPAPEPVEWLAEIDHGDDEGLTDAAIVARVGAGALALWDEAGIAPPGWIVDRDARHAAWRALFADAGGDDAILCVTSNGAARFALSAAPALLAGQAGAGLKLRTGAWGEIVVEHGTLALRAWDRRPTDA